jgi:hypothetical protein
MYEFIRKLKKHANKSCAMVRQREKQHYLLLILNNHFPAIKCLKKMFKQKQIKSNFNHE